MIWLWSLLLCTQSCFSYTFTELNSSTGAFLMKSYDIFISYNNWRFVFYYDLSDYYNDIELYKECMNKMRLICNSLPEKMQCEILVAKHENILRDVKMDVEYLEKMQHNRKRRQAFLGAIGSYLYKPIFGLMDEDDASEIIQKVNKIIQVQQKHQLIMSDSMSISR